LLLGDDEPRSVRGATLLPSVTGAVTAIQHATRYAEWRRDQREPRPLVHYSRASETHEWVRGHLERSGPGWLHLRDARILLSPYGVVPAGTIAQGIVAIVEAARELGFPVALKVAEPTVVHKTERGLVRAGLTSADEVAVAAGEMARVMANEQVEVLVQPMAIGTEVAIGVVRDPGLGPLVRVAAGGVATELWDDQRLLIAPVTRADAQSALRSLRIWPLLAGFRGQPATDVNGLVQLVTAVGMLAYEVPELGEMDLNPVIVHGDGCELVDVKVRLTPAEPWDPGVPRRLRRPAAAQGG